MILLSIFTVGKKYIENNNVKAVITSHSVYTIAIPLRIAIKHRNTFICL